MKRQLILGSVLTLLGGGIIYLLFRTSSLKMFNWFETIGFSSVLIDIRNHTLLFADRIPEWILFSLPDGLWVFSYVSLMLLIWQNTITVKNIFWILIIPFLAIFSEIGQLFGLIIGTFDVADVLFYILGMILPFIIYKKSISLNFKT